MYVIIWYFSQICSFFIQFCLLQHNPEKNELSNQHHNSKVAEITKPHQSHKQNVQNNTEDGNAVHVVRK